MNKQQESEGDQYRWYIEPKNEHTNEVLSRDLSDFGHKDARIKRKIERIPVWEATNYDYVAYFQRSHRNNRNIEFKVYTQKKGNEKNLLYPWPFDAAKRSHQARKKKAA